MELYRYQPLPSSSDSLSEGFIRLLELQPGQGSEQIECNLRSVPLLEDLRYEALSYTWGDPNIVYYISLEGCQFGVASNLLSALLHLRQRDKPRILWIDAVCIDQTNSDEKTSQVLLMRRIYETAMRVLIWLGEGSEECSLGLTLIPKLLEAHNHRPELTAGLLVDPDQWTGIDLPKPGERHWKAINTVFKRPYWKRIWIVQEVAVAQKGTVICGSMEIDFDDMYQAMMFTHSAGIGAYVAEDFESLIQIGMIRKQHREGKWLPLLFLLSLFRTSKATDARDKVFALLGLATGIFDIGDLYFIPDYSLSLAEVYGRVAQTLISATSQIDCLEWARGACLTSLEPELHEDLPTWVPDWRDSESIIIPIGYSDKQPFWATGDSHYTPQLPELRGTLTVRGHITDSVLQIAPPFTYSPRELLSLLTTWETLVTPHTQTQYSTSQEFASAFCHTLIADTSPSGHRASKPDTQRVEALITYLKRMQAQNSTYIPFADPELSSARHSINVACGGRTMAVTQKGYMALVPTCTKTGDLICLIKGGRVPFVVQRAGTEDREEQWVLVGHCYVHGIMHGEAFREEECVDMRLV